MISHTCDFLVVSDRSTYQKENEKPCNCFCLLSCFYFPLKLPVLLKCTDRHLFSILAASPSLAPSPGSVDEASLVRCWRSRSHCWWTCVAMFIARAHDEHITHAHAHTWWTRGRHIATYNIHTYVYIHTYIRTYSDNFLVVLTRQMQNIFGERLISLS